MIETITSTGARHFTLPEAPGPEWPGRSRRRRRRPRVLLVLFALIVLAALAAGGFLLYQRQAASQPPAPATAATPVQDQVALPALPPPDLFRSLSPEAAQQANASRPVEASAITPAAPFRFRGDEISRMRAIDCLTQAIYYEAASEGIEGGRAVAQVVLNRMRHPGYPNSVCAVIYQGSERVTGCQFSFTCDGALARTPVPYLWARSRQIANEALAGRIYSPVGYSTHYHADYVVPYWAASLDKTAVIGRHIFYSLRGAAGSRGAFRQGYAGREPVLQLPSPEVIAAGLDALETLTAPTEVVEEPRVEEDRIEALVPDQPAKPAESARLEADLARGQLIIGEAAPGTTARPKVVAESGCKTGPIQQIRPMGATQSRVGAEKQGC